MRARRVSRRISGVFIRGFPPNKKTTRQRTKQKNETQHTQLDLSVDSLEERLLLGQTLRYRQRLLQG